MEDGFAAEEAESKSLAAEVAFSSPPVPFSLALLLELLLLAFFWDDPFVYSYS